MTHWRIIPTTGCSLAFSFVDGRLWLDEIYIKPRYRGIGLGRRVIKELCYYAKLHNTTIYFDNANPTFWGHMASRYKQINLRPIHFKYTACPGCWAINRITF